MYIVLPSLILYIGLDYIDEPWLLVIGIHFLIMLALPTFMIEVAEFYNYTTIDYGFDLKIKGNWWFGFIFESLILPLWTTGIQWLICRLLGDEWKSLGYEGAIPDHAMLKLLVVIYFIVFKPYIVEWFWRRYLYGIFPSNEFFLWLTSIFFAYTYSVFAYQMGVELKYVILICVAFSFLGRIFIWIKMYHGDITCYITHISISIGVLAFYFLEESGTIKNASNS